MVIMRGLVCLASVLIATVGTTRLAVAGVAIQVDEIQADQQIKGTVTGVRPPERYKVVVYVHTDRWYIHPYAGQGEGMSWAAIGDDGTWTLKTVRRAFKADKMAALVVEKDASVPAKAESLGSIPKLAIHEKVLTGTTDEGKL
jgi:hypothetical protein